MQHPLSKLPRCRHWQLACVAVPYLAAVAALDHQTGTDVPLLILYLPLIALSCWLVNLSTAVCLSLVCAVLWLLVDRVFSGGVTADFSDYWITVVHFVFFVVIATVLWRLRLAQEAARRHATTDFLTGLANSQAFVAIAEHELAESRCSRSPLTIVFADCDRFKAVNDTLGHLVGDEVLRIVASSIEGAVRSVDIVARMGGDEFAVLLPELPADRVREIVRRIRSEVNAAMQARGWPVTLSVGAATFDTPPDSVDELIRQADDLMYKAKRAGSNEPEFSSC